MGLAESNQRALTAATPHQCLARKWEDRFDYSHFISAALGSLLTCTDSKLVMTEKCLTLCLLHSAAHNVGWTAHS